LYEISTLHAQARKKIKDKVEIKFSLFS